MDPLLRAPRRAANDARLVPPSEVDVARFAFDVLSPRRDAATPELLAAYLLWKSVWGATFRELDDADRVFSDDLTRQDEIGVLTYDGEPAGMFFHREVDFARPFDRDDSYFKPWPPEAIERIAARGTRVCIGSNLTVAPAWRGKKGGVSVKEVLLAESVRMFVESDADVLVGTMRNDRGMNRLGYRLGAERVFGRATHHGVEVDLIATWRGELEQDLDRATADLVESLWMGAVIRKEQKNEGTTVQGPRAALRRA